MKKAFDIFIFVLLLLIDQVSKYLITAGFKEHDSIPVIKDFFHMTYVRNKGVAFGIFYGHVWPIAIIGLLAVIGILVYHNKNHEKMTFLVRLALMFILAGALGNLIDRSVRGFVVDFIDFRGIWSYVFNIADTWINVGVGLVCLDAILVWKRKKDTKEETK